MPSKITATVTGKRERGGGHFVEDHAERKQIGAGVQLFAAGLLGRHIRDRADGAAGAGEEIGVVELRLECMGDLLMARRDGGPGGELGEAEVQNFCGAASE